MKRIFLLMICLPLMLAGCNDDLEDRVDGLEKRVGQLETLCNQMNTNIASLQQIVEALRNNDAVESVVPVVENGKTVGYTITFTKSDPITIYHGTDGKEGHTPTIGVALFGGTYYWTVDGQWLAGPDGGKIRAEGGDAPQLKIENGNWMLSTDGGTTWKNLGKATGADGTPGFTGVEEQDGEYVFTLSDGTKIRVPKATRLAVVLAANEFALTADAPVEIAYTLTGATADTKVEALSFGPVKSRVISSTMEGGVIEVMTEDPAAIDEYTKVLVIAADGLRSALAAMTFESGVLRVTEAVEAAVAGQTVSIAVETNLEYEVEIEAAAQSWLSQIETRALRTDNLQFKAEANDGPARSGLVTLTAGSLVKKVCIAQQNGQVTYAISIPTDFSEGFVQKVTGAANGKQIAEICREYIRTGDTDAQLTIIYPCTGGKADLTRGFEISTGGSVVWDTDANTCTYTPGNAAAALTAVHLRPDGTFAPSTEDPEAAATVIVPDLLTDVRGSESNTYRIVKIGTQYWMAENLRAERYADGTALKTSLWNTSVTEGSYVYLFDEPGDNKMIFGALYNGYAVQNTAGLAPEGWSVADNVEWLKLKKYLGTAAGTKIKSRDYWTTAPTDATGIAGLDVRPGFSYNAATQDFESATVEAGFWSNTSGTDFGQPALHYMRITDRSANMTMIEGMSYHGLAFGHSVRCVRK